MKTLMPTAEVQFISLAKSAFEDHVDRDSAELKKELSIKTLGLRKKGLTVETDSTGWL